MDSMKEVLFPFDEMKICILSERDVRVGPMDITKVPILQTTKIPAKQRKKIITKVWERTKTVVGA